MQVTSHHFDLILICQQDKIKDKKESDIFNLKIFSYKDKDYKLNDLIEEARQNNTEILDEPLETKVNLKFNFYFKLT